MADTSDINIERAGQLDTTALSDALDRLGIEGQCLGIKPLHSDFRLVGRAFTILYGPAATPPGTVGDFIDDIPPDTVIVIEAMKMLHPLTATGSAVVDEVLVAVGDQIESNQPLVTFATGEDR